MAAVAESSSSASWQIDWQETNHKFYKTLNKIRIQQGFTPISHSSLQTENQENDRSIFVKIHVEKYEISEEVIEQVFYEFGVLESIKKFGPSAGFHSQVRFQNKESAIRAFNSLNGRNVYDNCCQLELSLVVSFSSNQEREIFAEVEVENRTSEIEGAPIEDDGDCQEEAEAPDANANQFEALSANANQETEFQIHSKTLRRGDGKKLSESKTIKATEEPRVRQESLKVIPKPLDVRILKVESKERQELVDVSTEAIIFDVADFRIVSVEICTAHKVFVEMSRHEEKKNGFKSSNFLVVAVGVTEGNVVFDPGIIHICIGLDNFLKTNVHTFWKNGRKMAMLDTGEVDCSSSMNDESEGFLLEFEIPENSRVGHENRGVIDACDVFDGPQPAAVIKCDMIVVDPRGIHLLLRTGYGSKSLILVFDPGGFLLSGDEVSIC